MRPQTIQIFLPNGSPTGVREAELTNRLIKAIHFPRTAIEKAAKREVVQFTGVYFLFGQENGNPKVYIGEGEICWKRIQSHHRTKDFWDDAIICATRTNTFTKSEAKFLEHSCLEAANKSGRYLTANDTGSKMPSIPETRVHDLLDNLETIKTLVSALGFQVFKSEEEKSDSEREFYYCKGKDAYANGEYTEEGMWVLEGSIANLNETKTAGNWVIGTRKRLLESGHLVENGDTLKFAKRTLFKSVSTAAAAVLARRANGWIEWKNKQGVTLDRVKRK